MCALALTFSFTLDHINSRPYTTNGSPTENIGKWLSDPGMCCFVPGFFLWITLFLVWISWINEAECLMWLLAAALRSVVVVVVVDSVWYSFNVVNAYRSFQYNRFQFNLTFRNCKSSLNEFYPPATCTSIKRINSTMINQIIIVHYCKW